MSVNTALAAIVDVVASVSGIRQAPLHPTETANVYPFAISYIINGEVKAGAMGTRKHLVNIGVELLTARKDMARDFALITPFIDSICAAFLAEVSDSGDRFGSTISTFDTVKYDYIDSKDYAGVTVVGYLFTLTNVKILENTA